MTYVGVASNDARVPVQKDIYTHLEDGGPLVFALARVEAQGVHQRVELGGMQVACSGPKGGPGPGGKGGPGAELLYPQKIDRWPWARPWFR